MNRSNPLGMTDQHKSDCAVHNAPAFESGPCDCATPAATITAHQLRNFVDRIERLEQEKAGIADDIKDCYGEAKSLGYDVKILRKVIAARKKKPNERREEEELMVMRVLDLFSGIGGFSLGLERAGMKTVAFCEIDPFCRRVLAKHWPEVPILDDVSTAEFPAADIIVGGFPCQDISCAGLRAGLSGARSGLYRELVRAIRMVRPKHAIMENVADLLGNGLGTVLGDLAEIGADAEWDCVPAQAVGAPHERDRIWIVAHTADATGERCGEAGQLQHRPDEMSSGGATAALSPDSQGLGCGSRREGRPPDSFARVRDEACRNAADRHGARLAFREGIGRDAWEERKAAERDADQDERQSIWPDEPALLGVVHDVPDRVDRTRALGNSLIPYIPELIGRAIMSAAA